MCNREMGAMKRYIVSIDDSEIGYTNLECADPPMGVVFGKVVATHESYGYEQLRRYCTAKSIEPIKIDESMKLIHASIPGLKIHSDCGTEIKGKGVSISCVQGNELEVEVVGISHLLYEDEFAHHVAEYESAGK